MSPGRRRRLLVVSLLAVALVGLARRSPTARHRNDEWPPVPRAPLAPAEPPTA